MHETLSDIIYFCPWISSTLEDRVQREELKSIEKVVETLKAEANIDVATAPTWANLITVMQDPGKDNLLVVFRLDFLERENMMLGEVLTMLSSMTKFVSNSKKINIAVVVPDMCNSDLIADLKRNEVLGIIPGMRFFNKEHSIAAYENFNLIAKRGLSNRKIADVLKISEYTVKIHVSAILRLYGVKNRTQLALASDTGIIK